MAVVRAPPRRAVLGRHGWPRRPPSRGQPSRAAEPSTPTTTTSDPVRGAGGAAVDMAFSGRGGIFQWSRWDRLVEGPEVPLSPTTVPTAPRQRPHTRTSGDLSGPARPVPAQPTARGPHGTCPGAGPQSAPRARSRGSRDQAPRSSGRSGLVPAGPGGSSRCPASRDWHRIARRRSGHGRFGSAGLSPAHVGPGGPTYYGMTWPADGGNRSEPAQAET